MLHGRTHEHGPVVPRHEIATRTPHDTPKPRTVPRQLQQLTTNRIDRDTPDDGVDVNRPRPASRREHDGITQQRAPIGFDFDAGRRLALSA